MKHLRKVMALMLAAFMTLAVAMPAFAANASKDAGKGGQGTLTIENAHAGQTYELYRVFEAVVNASDNAKVSYKPLAGKTIPENDYFDVVNGYIQITDAGKDANDSTKLSTGAVAWLTENYAAIGERVTEVEPTEEGAQVVTGLQYGYYYVTTTTGTAVSVDTTHTDAVIEDKNPGTSIDKTITGASSIDATGENALAQVGSTVDYEVRIQIAQNAKTYKFTDVMDDGLTYVEGSMNVYVVESGAAATDDDAVDQYGTLTEAADATGTNADVTIDFDDALLAANNGKDIVLQYQAIVNENAVVAAGPNTNTATINWGHETDTLKDEDEANVYAAQIVVKKLDENEEPLEGAGFKLQNADGQWYKLDNGLVTWVDAEADGTEILPVIAEGATDAVASFTGLADGTYTLVETTVPDGYNKADNREVTIDPATTNDLTLELSVEATVTNQSGSVMPSTGGIGTTIFYIIGGILLAGGAIVLISKRRVADMEK